jgi:hypothetical protein
MSEHVILIPPERIPIYPIAGPGGGTVYPPSEGDSGSGSSGNCEQLKQAVTNLENQLALWQAKLASTSGPDAPGTPRDNIRQTIAMVEQELSASQAALLNAGCLGSTGLPDCSQEFNTSHGKITITGVICRKWTALSLETTADGQDVQTYLGNPTGSTQFLFQTNRELIIQYFDRGVIVDIQGSNSPWVVYGSIYVRYQELGGITSFLGVPVADEAAAPNSGRVSKFEAGDIYWRADAGVHEVHGDIRDKYDGLGAAGSFLGYPTTDEMKTSDGVGRFNHFQGGSIYWTQATGAHEVHGAIRDEFDALGGIAGFLSYPTTDETRTPDGIGRFNHFQDGSIYWTPATGAHEVHGIIRDKWAALGWERSYLRYPITDVMSIPNGQGTISNFQRGHIHTDNANAFDVADALVFDTGPMRADYVTGWAQLAITSNGFWSFRGHVHDAAFIGHNYAVGVAIDFRDASGKTIAVTQEGSLHGTLAVGDRVDDWQQNGSDTPDSFIVDNWDALRHVGIKWTLHVSTSAIDVVETIVFPLTVVVIGAGLILFASDPKTTCTWFPGPDPNNPDDPKRPILRCEQP